MMKRIAIACLLAAGCRAESSSSRASGSAAAPAAATDPGAGARSRPGKIDLGVRPGGVASAAGSATPTDDVEARRRARMAAIDTDGDGVISADERAVARRARAEGMRDRYDRDHDGKLTPDELAKSGWRRFDPESVDLDHDGDISVDELGQSIEQRSMAWGAGRFRLRGRRPGPHTPAAGSVE